MRTTTEERKNIGRRRLLQSVVTAALTAVLVVSPVINAEAAWTLYWGNSVAKNTWRYSYEGYFTGGNVWAAFWPGGTYVVTNNGVASVGAWGGAVFTHARRLGIERCKWTESHPDFTSGKIECEFQK